LSDLGIPVVFDRSQVGSNLQDHLDLYAICEVTGPHTYDRYAKPLWSAVAGIQYLLTKRGPVASSLFETGGFWYADPEARSPDVQLHLGLGTGIESGVAAMPQGGVTLNACYLRPRSRGSVRLQSADPSAAPLIDPNYLADPRDRELSIEGLKLAQRILAQEPLKPFIKAERLPGPGVKSDEDYFAFICEHSKTSHHAAGTCRMGPDDAAVVDTRLRFNGIEGLRVADASIMPTVISSNTNAAAIMIGEKAADMIRADHGV
jgi:choline dehydrogenase-like flavoprotein